MTREDEDPPTRRTSDQDIRHIRRTLDDFAKMVSRPMQIVSWVIAAMIAGIAGTAGVKVFKAVVKWSLQP